MCVLSLHDGIKIQLTNSIFIQPANICGTLGHLVTMDRLSITWRSGEILYCFDASIIAEYCYVSAPARARASRYV